MSLLGAMKTCLASTLKWRCITSTSSWMLSQSNNNNDGSDLILWRELKPMFRNSLNVASFERNSTQAGLLTLYPFLKRMEIFESILNFVILIQHVLKMNFCYPSRMPWLTTHVVSKGCHLQMDSQGTVKSRCARMIKNKHHSKYRQVCFAIGLCHLA